MASVLALTLMPNLLAAALILRRATFLASGLMSVWPSLAKAFLTWAASGIGRWRSERGVVFPEASFFPPGWIYAKSESGKSFLDLVLILAPLFCLSYFSSFFKSWISALFFSEGLPFLSFLILLLSSLTASFSYLEIYLFDKIFKFRFLASAHGFWRMILRLFENLPLESLRNK